MQKETIPRVVGLIVTCALIFFITACAMLRSKQSFNQVSQDGVNPAYRGKIASHIRDGQSHYVMGCAFQERKKHSLAIKEFKLALKIDADNAAAYNGLGISLDALGDFNSAMSAYRTALMIDPYSADIHNNLGFSYLLQGRPDMAIQSFSKAIALDHGNRRYTDNLGLAYSKIGDYDGAFKAFCTIGNEATAHMNVARLYYRDGDFEKAAVHYTLASNLKPSNREAEKAIAASSSLARIHSTKDKKNPVETKKTPVAQSSNETMARFADNEFLTIPAGVIEELEPIELDKSMFAESSVESVDDNDQQVFTATVAQLADIENEDVKIRENTEESLSREFDETRAMELLSFENTDTFKRSNPRINIEVSNGNGVRHMARQVGSYLSKKGVILMYLSNADHFNYDATKILYTKGYLSEAYRLSQELPGLQHIEEVDEIKDGNAEICIRIGRDLVQYASMFEQI